MKGFLTIVWVVPALLCALACTSIEEVASNLSAKQSVEVLVALQRSGIQASREATSSGRSQEYRVLVSASEKGKAFEILHEYGLPRQVDESLEEITRPRGFAPNSPQLSRLRVDHALELRIERALLALPGVIEAKVIVRTEASSDVFGAQEQQRGASVVVRSVATEDAQQLAVSDVQDLVAQAIPGVSPTDVNVRMVRAALDLSNTFRSNLVQLKPFSFRVPAAERGTAGVQILIMFAAFCFAGLLLGLAWSSRLQASRRRRFRAISQAENGRSMFLEASMKGNARTKQSLPQIREEEE